jgi:hypothetical protein
MVGTLMTRKLTNKIRALINSDIIEMSKVHVHLRACFTSQVHVHMSAGFTTHENKTVPDGKVYFLFLKVVLT